MLLQCLCLLAARSIDPRGTGLVSGSKAQYIHGRSSSTHLLASQDERNSQRLTRKLSTLGQTSALGHTSTWNQALICNFVLPTYSL